MKNKADFELKTTTIDIHNMLEIEALKLLEKEIKRLHQQNYRKIIIIHGYRKGQVLKNMVNKKLRSKLILKKEQSAFNLGETIIFLK